MLLLSSTIVLVGFMTVVDAVGCANPVPFVVSASVLVSVLVLMLFFFQEILYNRVARKHMSMQTKVKRLLMVEVRVQDFEHLEILRKKNGDYSP